MSKVKNMRNEETHKKDPRASAEAMLIETRPGKHIRRSAGGKCAPKENQMFRNHSREIGAGM